MKTNNPNILYLAIAVIFLIPIAWWMFSDPTNDFMENKPGMDKRDEVLASAKAEVIKIGEFFRAFVQGEETLSETWPQFRGENSDNISRSAVKLRAKFDEKPPILWQYELGEGHAGAAIYKGLVYLLDYDEKERADMLRCFRLKDGEEVWRRWYKVNIKRNHGISRTVPAVTEDYILTIGPRCHVMCCDRKTGELLWGLDIEKEFGGEVPLWYTGQCPFVDGNEAIIATGGTTMLIGVDLKTGKVNWQTPNEKKWKMSHSSVMPYKFGSKRMYVYAAVGGILAISGEEGERGKILWQNPAWNHSVVAPSPVCMPDGKIFLTAGYGAGAMMLQLSEQAGNYTTTVIDEYKPKNGLASEQQTPIYYDGKLFGISPKDGGMLRNQLVCVDPSDTKEILWSSGKTKRFGLGPYLISDGKLFLWNDDGTLFILEASTKGYSEIASYKLLEGHDAWAPIALADGYMVLRDSKHLLCLDLNFR